MQQNLIIIKISLKHVQVYKKLQPLSSFEVYFYSQQTATIKIPHNSQSSIFTTEVLIMLSHKP